MAGNVFNLGLHLFPACLFKKRVVWKVEESTKHKVVSLFISETEEPSPESELRSYTHSFEREVQVQGCWILNKKAVNSGISF